MHLVCHVRGSYLGLGDEYKPAVMENKIGLRARLYSRLLLQLDNLKSAFLLVSGHQGPVEGHIEFIYVVKRGVNIADAALEGQA